MAAAARYRIEHVAARPRGWRVRSKRAGSHVVRVGFPPGPQRKGAGKVLQILHPKDEHNPNGQCIVSHNAKSNPEQLLIFNPSKTHTTRKGGGRPASAHNSLYEVVEVSESGSPRTMTKPLSRGEAKKFLGEMRAARDKAKGKWTLFMRRTGNPIRMQVFHDPGIKKFTAAMYDPKFGNLYASGFTKKEAARALRERWRESRSKGTWRNPRRKRRNPISETEQAVHLFEVFHGKEPREIVDKHVSAAVRKDYTALGKLIAVVTDDCGLSESAIVGKWDECPHIDFSEDHVTLASSPDGATLYAIGGNQNLTGCLNKFEGVDPEKDFIDLGEVAAVVYEARKIHDNFEPVHYVHKFGGRGTTRPAWMFDRLKKQIFFVGGEYKIDITQKISPGIEG